MTKQLIRMFAKTSISMIQKGSLMKVYFSLILTLALLSCGGDKVDVKPDEVLETKSTAAVKEVVPETKVEKAKIEKKVTVKTDVVNKIPETPEVKDPLKTKWGQVSYCLGLQLGSNLHYGKFDYDKAKVKLAFKRSFSGHKVDIKDEEVAKIKKSFDDEMKQRQLNKDHVIAREVATNYFYVVGHEIAANISKEISDINTDMYLSGMMDGMENSKPQLSQEIMSTVMKDFQQEISEKMNKKNIAEGKAYLDAKRKEKGVQETKTGLLYKVIKEGEKGGKSPTLTSKVKVHYHGTFVNGSVFDSSYSRDPIESTPMGFIPGWKEALPMMKVGDVWMLYVPYNLAYGERGNRGIQPYTTLIFKMELLEVN